MGLFGGFKGKLIGKVKKQKEPKETRIICMKFHTFSEFDSPSDGPSCSNTNPGKTEVVKERRRPTKPEVKNIFNNKVNGDVNTPKAAPAENGSAAVPTKTENGTTKAKSGSEAAKPATKPTKTGSSTAKPAPATKARAPVVPPTKKEPEAVTSFAKVPKKEPEAVASFAKVPKKEPEAVASFAKVPKKEPEAVTSFAQVPAKEDPEPVTSFARVPAKKEPEAVTSFDDDYIPSPIVMKKSQLFSKTIDSDSEDDGNFQIHIAQHNNNVMNLSNDEDSDAETAEARSPINYSSQATSIFFGEDEEPIIRRPRNFVIGDDDDNLSDGSSASA